MILSPIYRLSAEFSPLQTARHPQITHGHVAVFVVYFAVHRAGVTNVSPNYNLSPLRRYIAVIGV